VVDEAHHLLPASRENIAQMLPEELPSVIFITTHPDAVSVEALRTVEVVIALGDKASDAIAQFCELIGLGAPRGASPPGDEEALFWDRSAGERIRAVKVDRPQQATSATRASTPRASSARTAAFTYQHAAINPIMPGHGSLICRTGLERKTTGTPDRSKARQPSRSSPAG